MTKPMIKEVNAETGVEIEREMNAAELAQLKLDEATEVQRIADLANKETARQAVLDKLRLTPDEVSALFS